MWKTFWPNVELRSRMNPFGNGATDSGRNMRESLRNDKADWVTPGIDEVFIKINGELHYL